MKKQYLVKNHLLLLKNETIIILNYQKLKVTGSLKI